MIVDLNQKLEEKPSNEMLYLKQVEILKSFLERGAISQAQYDKSYADLTAKMRIG